MEITAMTEEEIKRAVTIVHSAYDYTEQAFRRLILAWVDATARAEMWEWKHSHRYVLEQYGPGYYCLGCGDGLDNKIGAEEHKLTLADRRQAVLERIGWKE